MAFLNMKYSSRYIVTSNFAFIIYRTLIPVNALLHVQETQDIWNTEISGKLPTLSNL